MSRFGAHTHAKMGVGFGLVIGFAGLAAFLGCGGGDAANGKAKAADGARATVIEHEPCEASGRRVEAIDTNNDGKPDIRRFFDGQREVCRITDLNHDGRPEMYEYYDANGQVRRRESNYSDSGILNSAEYFEGGKLVRRELDTASSGRIDTWDTFDPNTGKRVKRERDTTGDGKVDQWWTYEGDRVTIAMDRNGDGQPEPDGTIVLGPNGSVIAGDAGAVATAPTDAGVAPIPEPTPPPPAPSTTSDPSPLAPVDAGAVKPKRGGAKR